MSEEYKRGWLSNDLGRARFAETIASRKLDKAEREFQEALDAWTEANERLNKALDEAGL